MTVREAISFVRNFDHLRIGNGSTVYAEYSYKSDTLHAPARHRRAWDYQVLYIEQLADPNWLWLEVREL